MPDLEKVIYSIERCICHVPDACQDCAYDAGHPYNECVELLLKDALELLKDPDQVKVVRCRDCKHSKRMCQPWNDLICDKHGGANLPDWFCADGERGE